MPASLYRRLVCACTLLLAMTPAGLPQTDGHRSPASAFPSQERISYSIEWRLIYAGNATWTLDPKKQGDKPGWESKLHLESAGLVSRLYKLEDNYSLQMLDPFCALSTDFDSKERSRHRQTTVTYDHSRGKARYTERDMLKNAVSKTAEVDIPGCVGDIIGSLYKLRTIKLAPGQSTQLTISDGKKTVSARVEAQAKEQLKIKAGTFNTIRYEAFVFNGVLYSRKAQLLIWLADDDRRTPVQIRARMAFPIGSITFEMDKEQHS